MSNEDEYLWEYDDSEAEPYEEDILWGIQRSEMAQNVIALRWAYSRCWTVERQEQPWHIDFCVQYALS